MEYNYQNILVSFDNSPASHVALHKALDTAKRFNAKVYAVFVETPGREYQIENIEEALEAAVNKFGVKAELIQRKGKVYKEISLVEKDLQADLLFIGAHGFTGFQPFWIGSNAFRVVSASQCPVITTPENSEHTDFSNILVPLDSSPETRQKTGYAVSIARAFGSKLHLYGVCKFTDSESIHHLKVYLQQTEDKVAKTGLPYTISLQSGVNVPQSCIEYAKNNQCGLIMMMTETESSSFFMGTYAQQLINHSPVPVMAIHTRDLRLASGGL